MTKKIVAIGGGENGRILDNGKKTPYETENLDKEIIKLTNKKNPNFLFLAHAMCFNIDIEESYFSTMKSIYKDQLGCNCKMLKSSDLYNKKLTEELVNWADIIYEGGGDTEQMLTLWKETEFDKILKNAWINGKVISGISAGAVCYFNSCNADMEDDKFYVVKCLNWIDMFVTPHCDESGRYSSTKKQLKENKKVGLMLSNCSALEIIDNTYRIILNKDNNKSSKKCYAVKCYWKDNKFYEEFLTDSKEYKPLSELLDKNITT